MKTELRGVGTVDELRWGTNVIGKPAWKGGLWVRVDTYTSRESGEVFRERYFCADSKDYSPVFNDDMNGRYNGERCSDCFLNFGHTLAEHDKNIADGQHSK